MSKNLIVYFSQSGNTCALAKLVQEAVGGDFVALEPVEAYPEDYDALVKQTRPQNAANYRPALKNTFKNLKDYDTVFVGTPNWFSTVSLPVATFLEQNDLSGKKIAPFCTHGGGAGGHIEDTFHKMCPHSQVLPLLISRSHEAVPADVRQWLEKLGLK